MKKALVPILILTLLAGLAACSVQDPAETTQTPPFTVPIVKEPPILTVSIGRGDAFSAKTCTHEWNYLTEDGTWSGVCADCVHPLDMEQLLDPVETTVDQVELLFDVPPGSISVRCWSDSLFGNRTAPSTALPLSGNFLELRPGGCVYEVIATWDDGNAPFHGTVHYVFYTIKHNVAFAKP